jgi:hypothetical protein
MYSRCGNSGLRLPTSLINNAALAALAKGVVGEPSGDCDDRATLTSWSDTSFSAESVHGTLYTTY